RAAGRGFRVDRSAPERRLADAGLALEDERRGAVAGRERPDGVQLFIAPEGREPPPDGMVLTTAAYCRRTLPTMWVSRFRRARPRRSARAGERLRGGGVPRGDVCVRAGARRGAREASGGRARRGGRRRQIRALGLPSFGGDLLPLRRGAHRGRGARVHA